MEYLPGGIQMEVPGGCFPLTTDSMLLAHFAGSLGSKRILDLGSGCGTLGLLLCARNPGCSVTGIELDGAAHAAALQNIRRNGLQTRLESICTDLRRVPGLFAPGQFACCISNPPYFIGGPAAKLTAARREDCCSLAELIQTAGWATKYGGDFLLVHRPERLAEAIALAAPQRLEAKRLCLVHHREGGPVSLVLLQFRKGGKPGLRTEELTLYHRDGSETAAFREVYNISAED